MCNKISTNWRPHIKHLKKPENFPNLLICNYLFTESKKQTHKYFCFLLLNIQLDWWSFKAPSGIITSKHLSQLYSIYSCCLPPSGHFAFAFLYAWNESQHVNKFCSILPCVSRKCSHAKALELFYKIKKESK